MEKRICKWKLSCLVTLTSFKRREEWWDTKDDSQLIKVPRNGETLQQYLRILGNKYLANLRWVMIVQQNVNLSKLIVLKDNYLARRLVISLFSAALWSPATEVTSRGRRREERREEEEAIVRLVRILGEQQAEPSSSKLLKSGQGIARWVELSTPPPKVDDVYCLSQNWDKWAQLSLRLNMCCYLDKQQWAHFWRLFFII